MLYRKFLLVVAAVIIRLEAIKKFFVDRFVYVRRWWRSRTLHPCPDIMQKWFGIIERYPFVHIAWFVSELLPCFRYVLRPPPSKGSSRIVLHQANFGRRFPSNRISNTKYTILSFVTLNLFEQFRLPLNQYFLLVALLQFVDDIAPQSPLTTLLPLVIAFALTMIKEIGDDFRRRRQDRVVNYRPYLACQGACSALPGVSPLYDDDDGPRGRGRGLPTSRIKSRWPAPPAHPPSDFQSLFGVMAWLRGRRSVPNADGTVWVRSMDLRVGDIVVVPQGQEVPCDVFLIASSDVDGNAFIETAQMDGETDFKRRTAVPQLNAAIQAGQLSPFLLDGVRVQCEAPNPRLDSFVATLLFTDADGRDHSIAVGAEHLLPQATVLMNTEYVYGLVVYTGPETKVGLSRTSPPAKLSQLDRRIGRYAVFVFIFQVSCAIVLGLTGYYLSLVQSPWYLSGDDGDSGWRALIYIGRFFLLTSAMIPISFKMLVDVCKFMIGRFIGWDLEMTYVNPDTGAREPAVATSTAIAEDLGQVDVVLSDKTGTLTLNELSFAGAGVDGRTYLASGDDPLWSCPAACPHPLSSLADLVLGYNAGQPMSPTGHGPSSPTASSAALGAAAARATRAAGSPSPSSPPGSPGAGGIGDGSGSSFATTRLVQRAPTMFVDRATASLSIPSNGGVATMYVRAMLLCNTVVPPPPGAPPEERMTAVSPDEIALVEGAQNIGGQLISRSRDGHVVIKLGLLTEHWRVLREFPFSSERKRMSVLAVRIDPRHAASADPPMRELDSNAHTLDVSVGQVMLFTKGSDDILLNRCSSYVTSAGITDALRKSSRRRAEIRTQVNTYAASGLRTLVFTVKPLGKAEVLTLQSAYAEVAGMIGALRVQKYLDIDDAAETALSFVGTSAILDRLQPQVPETIAALQAAGIGVWMLTGDKLETARQIAYACNLLNERDTVLTVKGSSEGAVLDSLLAIKRQVTEAHPAASLGVATKDVDYDEVPQFQAARIRAVQKKRALTYARTISGGAAAPSLGRQTPTSALWGATAQGGVGAEREADDEETAMVDDVPTTRQPGFCLLVSGDVLEYCVVGAARSAFMLVTRLMRSVVCCRATPSLKGEVTAMLKATGLVTLAVGDGGNDVLMIQTAHIGVGIAGRDGRQAARAADFTIARFGYLRELLLVHGTYAYNRTSYVVRYSFYKSGLLVFAQVVYNFFALWSGQGFWDTYQVMMWNSVYTSIPSIAMVFDRILPRDWLIAIPELYANNQRGRPMSQTNFFIGFCGRGVFHAAILVIVCAYAFEERNFENGKPLERGTVATAAYTAMLFVQVVIIVSESHMMTWIQHLSLWVGCVVLYFVSMYVATEYAWEMKTGGGFSVMDSWMDDQLILMLRPVCIVGMLITFALIVLPHTILHALRFNFFPTPIMSVKRYIALRSDV